jgi:flagellar hook-associated protein 1 FlgK
MGSFSLLHVAKTGLFTSQKALEVTGHNIANANTEGYSRQRLELSAIPGISSVECSSGQGVHTEDLVQIRDRFLDYHYRSENSSSGELDTKMQALEYVEGVLGEPSDFGTGASMSNLFNSMEQLGSEPHDLSLRETVVQNAVKLTDAFRTVSSALGDYLGKIDDNIAMVAQEINRVGEQILGLNETIHQYEMSGANANDLRDQRNLLVDSLSGKAPVEVSETEFGDFRIFMGSNPFINNQEMNSLVVKPTLDTPYRDDQLNQLYWEGNDSPVDMGGGELGGLFSVRDGATEENQGIPYYMDQLDLLAQAVIQRFNEVNNQGYTLPVDGNESRQNVDFFDPDLTTAASIRVSSALLESGGNIAAATEEVGEFNWGNNGNLTLLSGIREEKDISVDGRSVGNMESFYQSIVSDLAINTSYYKNRSESQRELTEHIESQKLSVSEVSIDEEMANMVQYQQSYNAAAKLIAVVDEMLNTLINVVGG